MSSLRIASLLFPHVLVLLVVLLMAVRVVESSSTHHHDASFSAVSSSTSERIPPVIDLSPSRDADTLAKEIADACSTYGFFQATSHGISDELIARFRKQCQLYFELDKDLKKSWKRNEGNSRGYFDDELTKQRLDWKECLDVGVPGSRDWDIPDDSDLNACLDGFNQFPGRDVLPEFRQTVIKYFDACSALADRIARLMARGLGLPEDDPIITDLKNHHSSYLRMNHYPPCSQPADNQESTKGGPSPLGISPHKDSGYLTILLQDDDCHSLQAEKDGKWINVEPLPNALTINTGDMAQIISNGKYKAPLHRVLTNPSRKRYSAPFFYNPGYQSFVRPVIKEGEQENYDECLWGYFRAVRFAGDLTDLGVEIQIEDFEKSNESRSSHLDRQHEFNNGGWCGRPFNIDQYKQLLEKYPEM